MADAVGAQGATSGESAGSLQRDLEDLEFAAPPTPTVAEELRAFYRHLKELEPYLSHRAAARGRLAELLSGMVEDARQYRQSNSNDGMVEPTRQPPQLVQQARLRPAHERRR